MVSRRKFCASVAGLSLYRSMVPAACGAVASPGIDNLVPWQSGDWPWWRGPYSNGIAEAGQRAPEVWGPEEGVIWKTAVPGRGHGSPIVVGDQVLLEVADADRRVQALQCLDRVTGVLRWETIIHRDGLDVKNNEKSSMASASPACDGERFFVNFLSGDAVYMTALDRSGKSLWQTMLTKYVNHQGFGSSPLLYADLVIGVSDNKGGGAVVAMDRRTGAEVWRRERPAKPNYPSPVIFNVGGKPQLFLTGCDLVTSLDPLTGKVQWEVGGATTECVTTTVTDGERIFTSGGYPKNHVSAVLADGSGKLAWENNSRTYVPSMVLHEGTLYAVLDAGVAICWDSATGEELWKGRLGGTFSSSLVLVGDRIYATNEEGQTFIYRASREKLEMVAQNRIGENVFSTPAICGDRLYNRISITENGKRQEYVVCVGQRG